MWFLTPVVSVKSSKRDLSHPLIAEILCRVRGLLSVSFRFVFMWIPNHVGLAGNSVADIAAKAALHSYQCLT